jgi:flavorubredoxin
MKGVFMDIGIIVYSQTGNTLSVAEKLKDALAAKGHKVKIDKVTAEGEVGPGQPFTLKSKPDPGKYEALVFAAPVMAFTLNPAMKAYLGQMPSVDGKKAGCFVTQQLPAGWMGGNRAVKIISRALRDKGADVCSSAIVHWKDEIKRGQQIDEAVAALGGLF